VNVSHDIADDVEAQALDLLRRAVTLLADARRQRAPAMQPLVTADQLAELLAMPVSAIESKTRSGELPCIRLGRWIRYSPAEVLATLRAEARRL
jgi:hypothetical protein